MHALIKRSALASLILISAAYLTSCKDARSEGIGFVATYLTIKKTTRYYPYQTDIPNSPNKHYESITSGGQSWLWAMGGTEGGAPDSRGLPEWIEFRWQEQSPDLIRREGNERTNEEVFELFRQLPIKTYRVGIKNRIPQYIVDEILEAKRHRKISNLPEKMLWLKFMWVGDEIKLHWTMTQRNAKGGLDDRYTGGDPIPSELK